MRRLALLAALALSACAPGSGELELKFGHVGSPGSLFALSAEEFARVANERLAGRARVTVFGSSQLGGDELLLQKLKLGSVDFALPSSILSSQIDAFGLFDMPYLVASRDHMREIEERVFWPKLAPLAGGQKLRILAVWENGFRHITNRVRPIRTPDDLNGIKLRTPRGEWRVKMFRSWGANPTPMPLSEVFVALQTGVMDGQENPLAQIWASRFHEVQRYLSLTGHVYTPAYVTVGAERWSRLPEDVAAELQGAARDTQAFVHETSERLDVELLEKLREAGMEVQEVERAPFLDASQAIYDEFAAAVAGGGGLILDALAAAREPAG